MKTFEVGDEVQLRGFTTRGRVAEIRNHADGRWLVVRWHIGGWHTAPEDQWVKVVRTPPWQKALWWGVAIALGLLFVVGLALSAGQSG